MLNYLYALLESEARLAAAALGLDPGLGFIHVDTPARDSLACDLMEVVRPQVDAFLIEWITREALKREWTDQYVTVNAERPELKRFAGIVGRVVTVNFNNKALIDFQDGGWYDVTASGEYLKKLDPSAARAKFDAKANSAQARPEKQS